MFIIALLLIGGAALLAGTLSDLKTREIPDWLNYSLLAAALGIRLINSIVLTDWSFVLEGLYGFGLGMIIAMVMFYTGQWGGGDSKLIIAMGMLIGFPLTLDSVFISYLVNVLLIGALYGVIWSMFLAVKHRVVFMKTFHELNSKKAVVRAKCAVFSLAGAVLLISFFLWGTPWLVPLGGLLVIIILTLYAWLFIKSVEKACMHKWISPSKLVEGDWIAEEISIGGKLITGPKDLGIKKDQIALLRKKKVKKVLVKEGIPFVPPFFIAFILTYWLGNLLFLVL
ncbi:MAG: A24 family peptidase [Nanoarchaeota archaeon]